VVANLKAASRSSGSTAGLLLFAVSVFGPVPPARAEAVAGTRMVFAGSAIARETARNVLAGNA
jgi:hypothetical protein